jgi:hypothetical protein
MLAGLIFLAGTRRFVVRFGMEQGDTKWENGEKVHIE